MNKLEWGVVFSVLASAGSIIFSAGIIWTTVQLHDKEITALQLGDHDQTDRLARMETKIDLLLEDKIDRPRTSGSRGDRP